MTDFVVYLTSLGSKNFFPNNDNAHFSNFLIHPLNNMDDYKVGLSACFISSPAPADAVLICSNIVAPTYYNEKQLSILGVYTGSDVVCVYSNVAMNVIGTITCTLYDVNGVKISLNTAPLLVLHFRPKKSFQ